MSSIREKEVKCALCGTKNSVVILSSIYSIGAPDLDTRPPKMACNNLSYKINVCKNCGYCGDISKPVKNKEEILAICKNLKPDDELCTLFKKYSQIEEIERGISEKSLTFLLKAAWCADDNNECERAKALRTLIIQKFQNVDTQKFSFSADFLVVLTDVARRAELFDIAKIYAENAYKLISDSTVRKILRFQEKLILRDNADCYTVDDAEKNKIVDKTNDGETLNIGYIYPPITLSNARTIFSKIDGAGLYYHKATAENFFKKGHNSEKLSAFFDKDNKYDKNAIGIYFENELLCYVPKATAELIAKLPAKSRNCLYINPRSKTSFENYSEFFFCFDIVEKLPNTKLNNIEKIAFVKIKTKKDKLAEEIKISSKDITRIQDSYKKFSITPINHDLQRIYEAEFNSIHQNRSFDCRIFDFSKFDERMWSLMLQEVCCADHVREKFLLKISKKDQINLALNYPHFFKACPLEYWERSDFEYFHTRYKNLKKEGKRPQFTSADISVLLILYPEMAVEFDLENELIGLGWLNLLAHKSSVIPDFFFEYKHNKTAVFPIPDYDPAKDPTGENKLHYDYFRSYPHDDLCKFLCITPVNIYKLRQYGASARDNRAYKFFSEMMKRHPEMAHKVDLSDFYFEEYSRFIRKFKKYADCFNFQNLSPLDESFILKYFPELYRKCKLHKFSSQEWGTILPKFPILSKIANWDIINGQDCRNIYKEHPELKVNFKWENFNGFQWSWILENHPELDSFCDWQKLNSVNWRCLLEKRPELKRFYYEEHVKAFEARPYLKREDLPKHSYLPSDANDTYPSFRRVSRGIVSAPIVTDIKAKREFLDSCIEKFEAGADKFPYRKIHLFDWEYILKKKPEMEILLDKAINWRKLAKNGVSYLLMFTHTFPEFIPSFRRSNIWSNFDSEDWFYILKEHKYKDKCDEYNGWSKFTTNDWKSILKSNPRFIDKAKACGFIDDI